MKDKRKAEEIPLADAELGDADREAERVRKELGWPAREPNPRKKPEKAAA